eukprot:1796137-Amphidinium_carterae.2
MARGGPGLAEVAHPMPTEFLSPGLASWCLLPTTEPAHGVAICCSHRKTYENDLVEYRIFIEIDSESIGILAR